MPLRGANDKWRVITALAVSAALVTACGGDHRSAPEPSAEVTTNATGAAPATASPIDAAARDTYGYGANPSGAHYQPDVVVVGGGASSIRSASANSLVWTIAKSAPGADKLKVGSVMLLTSVATGRVNAIHDDGDSRIVTLEPVNVTDVIKDGSIDVDQAVPASAVSYQLIPDLPWAQSTPQDGELPSVDIAPAGYHRTSRFSARPAVAVLPNTRPMAGGNSGGLLPLASKSGLKVKVGDWTLSPTVQATKLGLGVERSGDLKVGVNLAFDTNNLRFHGIDTIKNGQTTHSGFEITGITGLTVSLSAGSKHGSADNQKIKISIPVEVNMQIPPSPATAGLPMNFKVSFTFSVQTAITGNNSTLVATGKWGLDGPIGFADGKLLTPAFSVKQSILDSVSGITLGPSGIVFALQMKFMLGVGIASLSAGPYSAVTIDLGVTNGSSLGAALARCRGATLDLKGTAGVGLELSAQQVPILKDLLPGAKYSYSLESNVTLLHRSQVVPDVPLCNA
jgi:hypothetical protein